MAGGVRWGAGCEQDDHQHFWAKATLGDLEVLVGTPIPSRTHTRKPSPVRTKTGSPSTPPWHNSLAE